MFTFDAPRVGEDSYYLMPEAPPRRFWLRGERLCELQGRIDSGVTLTGEDFLSYKQLRGRQDFFYFAKYIAGFNWLEWPLHGPIAYAWSAPNGTRAGGRTYGRFRLGVIPRAHLKTSLMTQAYCMWRLIRDPEERILIYTSTFDFAGTIMNYIRTTFEGGGVHGELFLQCYGDIIPQPNERAKWTTNDITIKRQGAYSDPSIKARGIGSRVVGGHHTVQLIDDLVVEELTRTQMDKAIRELDGLDPLYHSVALGERRYVGTPWAFYDPIVYITRYWKDALVVRLPWRDAAKQPIFTYREADRQKGLPVGSSLKEYTAYAEGIKRRNAWFFSCNTGEAPILMADWSFKRLDKVQVGELVMGWAPSKSGRRKLIPSRVLEKQSKLRPIHKMRLSSNEIVRCTPDHKWWRGNGDVYKPVVEGDKVVRIVDLIPQLPPEWARTAAWLGGVFDGEGTVHPGGPISISQSQKANPQVCTAIEAALNLLGFEWTYRKTHKGCGDYRIRGGRRESLKFLEWCQPVRGYKIRDAITRGDIARDKEEVVELADDGEDIVYSMQTETGNYVAWGLASRNCQYECYPKSEDGLGFRKEWFRYFTMKAQKFVELDRDEKETGKSVRIAECNTFILVDPNVIDPPGSRTGNTNVEIRRKGDFAAWIVLCVSPDNYWYIPRVIRWRCNVDQFLAKTHELVAVWQPKWVAIEQVAAQRLFFHLFTRDFRDGRAKFQIVPWQGGHASKPSRIRGLIPNYSNGFVLHRTADQPEVMQGINDLESELLDGEGAENDDASDALSAALPLVYPPGKDKPQQLDHALAVLKQDARWARLDPNARAEAEAWERKKRKGMVTGDELLRGVPDDDDEDPFEGLVSKYDMEHVQ